MARYLRRTAQHNHSRLRPPVVIGGGIVFAPVTTSLTAVRSRQTWPRRDFPHSRLYPPAVVDIEVFTPCEFTTDDFNRANESPIGGTWTTWTPFAAFPNRVVSNQLAPVNAGGGASKLRQTLDATHDLQLSWQVGVLTSSGQGFFLGESDTTNVVELLAFPGSVRLSLNTGTTSITTAVRAVAAGDQIGLDLTVDGGNETWDVWHKPGAGPWQKVISKTRPQITWAGPAQLVAFFGGGVTQRIDNLSVCPYWNAPVATALQSNRPPKTHSRLAPPAVLEEVVVTEAFYGPGTYLTRPSRGRTIWKLSPPTVLAVYAFYGPGVYLTRPSRGVTLSLLSPPAVVAQVVVETYYGPQVTLAPSRRPVAHSVLRPPLPVPVAQPVQTTLVRIRPRRTTALIRPPVVVFTAVELSGPEVHLTRIRPVPTRWLLRPPVVVTQVVVETYYGPTVTLAPSRRPDVKSVLRPPVIPPVARPITLTLARIRPRRTIHTLGVFPPQAVVHRPVLVHLTYSLRGAPKSRLAPPVVVGQPPFRGLLTHLTYSSRGTTIWLLRGLPTGASDVYDGPTTHLAPSARGVPKSRLLPVTPGIPPAPPIQTTLVRIRPRRTTTLLKPPTVVQAATLVFTGPKVELTYSRRGKPISFLSPPAVVGAGRVFRPVRVELAYSRRGRPISFFNPALVVRQAQELFGPETTLAPSKRGRPLSKLRPPLVVRHAVEIYGPRIELAPSRFPRPVSRLEPPVVVGRAPFRPLLINLTYSRRGQPKSFTTVAAAVRQPPFRGVAVHLAPSSRGRVLSLLKPPTVVGEPEQYFGPQVTLARIKHPPVRWLLKPPTLVVQEVPGDVDCDDSTPYDVDCETDTPDDTVACDTDSPFAADCAVTGSDSAATGATTASGSTVTAIDREA